MDYINDPSTITVGDQRRFRDGNASLGVRGTTMRALWANAVQEEILHVIKEAGLTPDENDWTQLFQAIALMIGGEVPFATEEIYGIVRLATALEGQGLSEPNAVITPTVLATIVASATKFGLVRLATSLEAKGGAHETAPLTPKTGLELLQEHFPPGLGPLPWMGPAAPPKWILCFGQSLNRTTYQKLYDAIGTTFGSVDANSFSLPDLRGRVIAGKDNMGGVAMNRLTNSGTGNPGINGAVLGAVGGSDRHILTLAQQTPHTHPLNTDNTDASGIAPRTNASVTGPASATGAADAHPNVQPTIVLNYIVYTGV